MATAAALSVSLACIATGSVWFRLIQAESLPRPYDRRRQTRRYSEIGPFP